jgi:3-deoxy-D-manno-octulosonate 8-phosphate phosphatase (KDO 8-P phosphatase)
MTFFKDDLKTIKAFVFDLDGVLSKDISPVNEKGEPVRTANVKDGFAIKNAIDFGYPVAVITGSFIEHVRFRYERLGVKHFYANVSDKTEALADFLSKTGIDKQNVLFMGDDLVDYKVMLQVGMPVCPKDAVAEIKAISKYISPRKGGLGCVRDVIEQTLRVQGRWFTEDMLTKKAN